MDGDDYSIDELQCPCGCKNTHSRHCPECDDGFHDAHDDDPINEPPGSFYHCEECYGHGVQRWCPECGRNWWGWPEAARKAVNPDDHELEHE